LNFSKKFGYWEIAKRQRKVFGLIKRKPSPPILPDPVVPVLSVAKPSLEKPDNFKNNKFEIPTDENVPWTLPFVVVYSCINYRWANQDRHNRVGKDGWRGFPLD
jgi:hypothetical protein